VDRSLHCVQVSISLMTGAGSTSTSAGADAGAAEQEHIQDDECAINTDHAHISHN